MFSPDTSFQGVQSASSRNPRRRQRNDSDSIRQQPQRKRSKLSDDIFLPPTGSKTKGNGTLIANGHADNAAGDGLAPEGNHEIPVREKKRATLSKKPAKGDGSTVLTKSANYTVKQLPGLPERLRGNTNDNFRARIFPSSTCALALTHTAALIWDYNTAVTTPVPRTLTLPYPSKRPDPLPLGSLVKNGTSSEIGLVVVMPTTGKITFWENVDSAESLSLFQQRRQGVEGSVGSMLSGEVVSEVVDAEHAGYILVFSTGRLAQLILRDTQGRPHINVQFLRNSTSSASGGLLGGLRSVFASQGWRKDVAAVKTRPSGTKGHMEVVAVTTSGVFQMWDVSWAGQSIYKGEVNAQMELSSALKDHPEARGDENVEVVDFAISPDLAPGAGALTLLGSDTGFHAVALVAVDSVRSMSYALVPLAVGNGVVKVEGPVLLNSYAPISTAPSSHKARLLVPSPGHTAFSLFGDAIVITSLTKPAPHLDSRSGPGASSTSHPFQDTLYFRRDRMLDFVGFDAENPHGKSRISSCIVCSRGAGLVRVLAETAEPDDRSPERSRASAKSKLEQAVFYGSLPENVLDLSRKSEVHFVESEVEEAALQISQEILSSTSEYISVTTASTEQQLSYRAKALADLALHLKKHYPPLNRVSKWQLLWDAEKMAAARGIWRCYDARLGETAVHQRPLLDELIDMLHERYKTPTDAKGGELDPVRHWFLKDVARIEVLVPWAFSTLGELHNEGLNDHAVVMQLISEADDLLTNAMEAAFNFRNENAALYGLEDEDLDEGLLVSGYEDLPNFWTSTHNIVNAVLRLADLARAMALTHFERGPVPGNADAALVQKIAMDNPRLVRLVCLTHIERYRWCLAQDDEKIRTTGRNLKHEFDAKVRHRQIIELAMVGMSAEGMKLAEKLRDMVSLADLVHNELDYLRETNDDLTQNEQLERVHKQKEIQDQVESYFKTFGSSWANAYYAGHIKLHKLGTLMGDAGSKHQQYLTKFLRADPTRAKVCWINDVVGERDFASASLALLGVSRKQEPNFWCKKVELSLAKLALMTNDDAANGTGRTREDAQKHSEKPRGAEELESRSAQDLKVLAIQEKIYNHVSGTAYGALDEDTAVDLVMQSFGKHNVGGRPALQQLLKRGFEELLGSRTMAPELLIDVLTLMDQAPSESDSPARDIRGREIVLALQALDASGLETSKQDHDTMLKVIWRRCFIRDDWQAINNTASKADELLQEQLERTTLLWTLKEGVSESLWDTSPSFRRLAPSDVLGAGCKARELASRFPAEELCEPIARDNARDDDELDALIQRCRLGYWFSACKEAAVGAAHREAEARAEANRAEREFRGAMVEPRVAEVDERDMNGEDEGPADGVGVEGEGEGEGDDGDGDGDDGDDVEMG